MVTGAGATTCSWDSNECWRVQDVIGEQLSSGQCPWSGLPVLTLATAHCGYWSEKALVTVTMCVLHYCVCPYSPTLASQLQDTTLTTLSLNSEATQLSTDTILVEITLTRTVKEISESFKRIVLSQVDNESYLQSLHSRLYDMNPSSQNLFFYPSFPPTQFWSFTNIML